MNKATGAEPSVKEQNNSVSLEALPEEASTEPALYIAEVLADAIKKRRIEKGISQNQLFEMTGVTQKTISFMETRRQLPTLYTLGELAKGLNLKVELIVTPGAEAE